MGNAEKFTILIVDDERSNLDLLMHILRPAYGIRVAKSGTAALKVAEEHLPDLIVLDVIMEGMSGFEALAALKESERTRRIPVILASGLTDPGDVERGLLAGAADYITKPYHPALLLARVETQLRILSLTRTIERLGVLDVMTGLPNRRAFDHQIAVEWRRAMRESLPLALILVDIDRLRQFNERHGQPQGDALLRALAARIRDTLKRPSDFAARLGGGEFAVLLPDTDMDGALLLAEQLLRSVRACPPPAPLPARASVTAGIGLAAKIPGQDDDIETFMTMADARLRQAKENGGDRICH